jgi:D-arabinose 1-dehydrogenase-like Zn-dependent alcohol dehydrogenase
VSDVCRRVLLHEVGWNRDLEPEFGAEVVPEPEDEEVVVAVEACGVCGRDLADREGRFPFMQIPIAPGHEAVGRVVAVGDQVAEWVVGDRVATMHRNSCGECSACRAGDTSQCRQAAHVFGLMADGGYARWITAPTSAFYAVPNDMPAAMAASLHCTFGTAWRCLVTVGAFKSGERCLITGANGGVGAAAVQIVSALGGEAVAVVRTPGHEEFLHGLGAEEVVVSNDGRFHKDPRCSDVDLALECVGSPTFNAALRAVRLGGRLVVLGNVDPAPVSLNLGRLIIFAVSILAGGGATRRDMVEVLAQHRRTPFHMPVARRFPLEEADAAQRFVRAGRLRGRVILDVRSEPQG